VFGTASSHVHRDRRPPSNEASFHGSTSVRENGCSSMFYRLETLLHMRVLDVGLSTLHVALMQVPHQTDPHLPHLRHIFCCRVSRGASSGGVRMKKIHDPPGADYEKK
jgi:hypothetical protein